MGSGQWALGNEDFAAPHCPLPAPNRPQAGTRPLHAVILAAGSSTRFGSQKLLAPLSGRALVRRTAENVLAAANGDVIVVVGRDADAVSEALGGLPVRFVHNPDFAEGMSTSLVRGIRALGTGAGGVLVALADQPDVTPDIIGRLAAAWRASGKPIAVPVYNGVRGNPVIFSAALFPELLAVTGDQGAREVIASDPLRVEAVPFALAPPTDVDTQEDYQRLKRGVAE